MSSRLFKVLVILAATTVISGCKLLVISPPGGDVTSLSGTRNCAGGSVCEFEVTAGFGESFTAVPKPGYQFVKWEKVAGFSCSDPTNPTCTVTLTGNADIDAIVIATFEIVHILPVYKDVGIDTDGDGQADRVDTDDDNDGVLDVDDLCPLEGPNVSGLGCPQDPVITVNGRQWYSPYVFRGHTRAAIEAICPGGVCISGGQLGVFDMTGWTWADNLAVRELLEGYLNQSPPVSCDDALTAMENDGFVLYPATLDWRGLLGWVSAPEGVAVGVVEQLDGSCFLVDQVLEGLELQFSDVSGWFYRDL